MNMPLDESCAREALCRAGRRLYERGLISGREGNLSMRLPDGRVLCTPRGVCKGTLEPASLCLLDRDGRPDPSGAAVSSEIRVHLAVYSRVPGVRAVVHAHPPHATAFAVARRPIPPARLPELDLLLGEVPLVDYQTPGTQALADAVAAAIGPGTAACLMASHGGLTWAESIDLALARMEMLEACCRVLWLAESLGGAVRLTDAQYDELRALRRRMAAGGSGRSAGPDGRSVADDQRGTDAPCI